jgi:hypothetical protein
MAVVNVKTWQNLLSDARTIVQDTETDPTLQRYPDQTLVDILNRGLQELYRIRTDAFYDLWDDTAEDFLVPVVGIYTVDTPPYTAWVDPFPIPMMFYNPLVSWVIGMLESVDDEFTEDSRSTAFLMQFKAMVENI